MRAAALEVRLSVVSAVSVVMDAVEPGAVIGCRRSRARPGWRRSPDHPITAGEDDAGISIRHVLDIRAVRPEAGAVDQHRSARQRYKELEHVAGSILRMVPIGGIPMSVMSVGQADRSRTTTNGEMASGPQAHLRDAGPGPRRRRSSQRRTVGLIVDPVPSWAESRQRRRTLS